MVTEAPFGSLRQIQSIALRHEVLRKPLGLQFDPAELKSEDKEVHVVQIQGQKVTGCMLLKPQGIDVLKMRQVAVDAGCQKQGIGKKMVAFAEAYAKQKGYHCIELNARKTAIPFYLNLDYTIEGEDFEEVGIPHMKMVKMVG